MADAFMVPGMNKPTVKAQPAPAQPVAVEEPPTPLTAEELQAGAKDLYKSLWGDDNPPDDLFKKPEGEPAIETPPLEPPTAAVETPPAIETPPPVTPETPATPPAPKLTTAEIITKTAREVGQQVAEAVRPRAEPQPEPQPEPTVELIPDDAEDLKAIQYLEETNPQKYAGKAKEFTDYVTAHYAYQEKWLQEHPGEQYNADAEEHQQWYQDNQPDIAAKDVDKAKVAVQVKEAYDREVAPKVREMEQEKAVQKAMPKIGANVNARKVAIVEAAAPELAKLLKDDKGAAALSDENIAKVVEADPIAAEILGNLVGGAQDLLFELEKVAEAGQRLQPDKNSVHAEIDRYRKQAESDLLGSTPEERSMNGKDFLPISEYNRRRNAIELSRGTRPDKEAQLRQFDGKYWTLTVDHLEELIVHDIGQKAKAIIAKQDAVAQKKYKKAAPPANGNGQPATPPTPAPSPAVATPRARPPSVSGQSDLVTTRETAPTPAKSYGETASDVMFK